MPKSGKKNHILGDFLSEGEGTKKSAKTGKEFGIEGKKVPSNIRNEISLRFFISDDGKGH